MVKMRKKTNILKISAYIRANICERECALNGIDENITVSQKHQISEKITTNKFFQHSSAKKPPVKDLKES